MTQCFPDGLLQIGTKHRYRLQRPCFVIEKSVEQSFCSVGGIVGFGGVGGRRRCADQQVMFVEILVDGGREGFAGLVVNRKCRETSVASDDTECEQRVLVNKFISVT